MKLPELFSSFLIFLLGTVGIGCLEITLDEFFFMCSYWRRLQCNASAAGHYQGRGTMVLNVGEELPQYITYDEKCPPSTECLTRNGKGTWRHANGIATTYCQDNRTEHIIGCHQVSGRTYRFYVELSFYYVTRFCTFRVRPCDGPFEECGPASNELKVSEIRTLSKYGYDTSEDKSVESFEKRCKDGKPRASENGKEEKRRPSHNFLLIFGVVLAIDMIVVC